MYPSAKLSWAPACHAKSMPFGQNKINSKVYCSRYGVYIQYVSFPSISAEIRECKSTPCLNGGKCIEGSYGSGVGSGLDTAESAYMCICEPGFAGDNCETSKLTMGKLYHIKCHQP